MYKVLRKIFGKMLTVATQLSVIILIITFLPGLPPDMDFSPFTNNVPPLRGPLSVNNKLDNSERLFKNEVKGPEDFAVYNNEVYTSCHGGVVYKITQNKLIPVVKTGKKCDGFYQEHLCGRPLGINFDKFGSLFIADAYYGLLKANVTSGIVETLVSKNDVIDGFRPMIPNSLTIVDNAIYWTDSSTIMELNNGLYTFLGNGNGRLIKYNIADKTNEVLIKNIHFANGLIASKDKSFLIISESFRSRLLRYYIKGPKAGTVDVFVELPGFPDNIHMFGKENFIVSLIGKQTPTHDNSFSAPLTRKFLSRLMLLVQNTFSIINYFYSSHTLEKIIHWIGHFEMLSSLGNFLINPHSISVVIDKNGNIVDSLHGTDGSVFGISAVFEHNNYYYLGSPFNEFLGRVKISK